MEDTKIDDIKDSKITYNSWLLEVTVMKPKAHIFSNKCFRFSIIKPAKATECTREDTGHVLSA